LLKLLFTSALLIEARESFEALRLEYGEFDREFLSEVLAL